MPQTPTVFRLYEKKKTSQALISIHLLALLPNVGWISHSMSCVYLTSVSINLVCLLYLFCHCITWMDLFGDFVQAWHLKLPSDWRSFLYLVYSLWRLCFVWHGAAGCVPTTYYVGFNLNIPLSSTISWWTWRED